MSLTSSSLPSLSCTLLCILIVSNVPRLYAPAFARSDSIHPGSHPTARLSSILHHALYVPSHTFFAVVSPHQI
ncbi:hypothetical protein C8R44DRAFT_785815 [Mycena epipterygia]|nr:hypothetical protein C8R44DRAFT_785815 [Mycena epipterygia]